MFFGMAAVFQIVIALLALLAQTGVVPTDGSSSNVYVSNSLSQHVSTKLKLNNNITSTSSSDEKAHNHVLTTASDVNTFAVDKADSSTNRDSILSTTDTADNTIDTGNVASERGHEKTADSSMHTGNVASERGHEKTADSSMHAGNVASERGHEKTADSSMHAGNVASESVSEQTVSNSMRESNVARESVHEETTDCTMLTGNVIATESVPEQIVDDTMPTGNVASEGVSDQAPDSQTTRSKSSAMNAGLDKTVTASSENIDAVSVSVHIRSEDDLTAESMLISMAITTVPTISSSFNTESPTKLSKDCDGMLCKKDAGYFVINTTACVTNDSPTIVTSVPTTVEILTNENSVSPNIICFWNIPVPEQYYVNVTIDHLVLEKDDGNGTQFLEFNVENDYKF